MIDYCCYIYILHTQAQLSLEWSRMCYFNKRPTKFANWIIDEIVLCMWIHSKADDCICRLRALWNINSIASKIYRNTINSLIQGAPNPKTLMFLVASCSCLCPIHWSQVLSREWRCSWSVPTGNAPTTSEWSTILLPKEHLILEIWWYIYISHWWCR